jgi:hypothetical protein
MNVDEADPQSVKTMALDERHRFLVGGGNDPGKISEQSQQRVGITKAAACDLAPHEGVHDNRRTVEQRNERGITTTEMIHPDRGINQDQAMRSERLRGETFILGSEPPRRARRLALSRSISAFSPSRRTAARSIGPIKLIALDNNSSSILMVVRMR